MVKSRVAIMFGALVIAISMLLRTHQGNYSKRDVQDRYGDWAIVAGASEGLGAAWAEHLCENGVNVLMVARRKEVVEASASRIQNKHGCRTDTLVQDLSDPNLADFFRSVLDKSDEEQEIKGNRTVNKKRRRYGMLVYNAAYIAPKGPFLDAPLEKQHTSIDVNVRGVTTLVHVFANYIRKEDGGSRNGGGGIVLMSSLAGFTGLQAYANYAATKAWNTQFAHGLYDELRQPVGGGKMAGIDILACVAGATWTPNYEKDGGSLSDVGLQQPSSVVTECLQALGKTPSLATGPFNKFVRFLFSRIMPHNLALHIMNQAVAERMVT